MFDANFISTYNDLVKASELQGVALVSVRAEQRPNLGEQLAGERELLLQVMPPQFVAQPEAETRRLVCRSRFAAALGAEEAEWVMEPDGGLDAKGAAILIVVEYLTVFRLPDGAAKDARFPDFAQLFAERNGVFNAWPYFRETVSSMAAKMLLPQVVVPLLNLPPLPWVKEQQGAEGGEKSK